MVSPRETAGSAEAEEEENKRSYIKEIIDTNDSYYFL